MRRVPIPVRAQVTATVDFCPSCGGVWIDERSQQQGLVVTESDQLVQLQGQAAGATADRWDYLEVEGRPARLQVDLEKYIPCLRCGKEMMRYRWNATSPVILDACPQGCGIWIDGGEVSQMKLFLQTDAVLPVDRQRSAQQKLSGLKQEMEKSPRPPSWVEWLGELLSGGRW